MRDVTQTATVVWNGSVARGEGELTGGSGALGPLGIDMPTRIGEASGKTTPEELLAAAQAACFVTALGSLLAQKRLPPERLEVTARVTLVLSGERPDIPTIELEVTGVVPGADQETFAAAVAETEADGCLIARVLKGGTIRIEATGTLA
jgi:osmotically inducible protein OsmC